MSRFFEKGYAVEADDSVNCERVWSLSRFGVTNVNKPGKVRLVFDAAAKTSGFSLNDQLDSGPDLLQPLPQVLIKFRQYAVAVKADIRAMYLRVKVKPEDRGALRFLWRGKDRKKHPVTCEMTCLIFGASCSACNALYVKDTNARTFSESKPVSSESVIKNIYVDDFLSSRK